MIQPATTEVLKDLRYAVAQLRHLYTHLKRAKLDGLADGLLSREVGRLEKLIAAFENSD